MDNKTYVREGFDALLPVLENFVADGMMREYGSGWKYETAKILGENSPAYDDDDDTFEGHIGVGACLEILRRKTGVISETLGEDGEKTWEALAGFWDALVRAGREDFDEEYAERALSAMEDFTEIAGLDCGEKIRALSEALEREDADDGSYVTLGGTDGASRGKTSTKYGRYEAAILLDECVKVIEFGKTRGEAVRDVSEKLRAMAVNLGKEIPEDYRNEDDVSAQLGCMEALYTGGGKTDPDRVGPENTVLFIETVLTYRKDRGSFDYILGEALEICGRSKGRSAQTPTERIREPSPNIVKMPNFVDSEAVILHDECMKVREHGKERAEAVRSVSEKLRKRAVNAGMTIPDSYRDIDGIDSQMRVMFNAIDHVEPSNKKTPKVFKYIVGLYSSQRSEYDRILKAALESCE